MLDAGDPATPGLAARTAATVLTVSAGDATADVRATRHRARRRAAPRFRLTTPWGSGEVALAVRGAHQVVNASLAAAVALRTACRSPTSPRGLAAVAPAPWRMEVARSADGVIVLNDAYNANPSSMAAALEALARVEVPGRRVAVLGEMRELGELERAGARRAGRPRRRHLGRRAGRGRPGDGTARRARPRRRRSPSPGARRRHRARRRRAASSTPATPCW